MKRRLKVKTNFFFKGNRTEFLELSKYNAAVDRHIFWEDRFEVASLI
jgi:hypothetical protein